MNLSQLRPPAGQKQKVQRVGQGMGTGRGKYSGRGAKGAKSISGYSRMRGFEGGQMPLHRRLPKRGFNNARFATTYLVVNVEALNAFDDGARVDEKALRATGLANGKSSGGIKILGDGKLAKKLTVVANAFSASARKQIEARGGACEVPAPKAA